MDKVKKGYNDAQSWGSLPKLKFPPLLDNPPRATPARDRKEDWPDLVVICVETWGKFPSHYVFRLQKMVERHLSRPHTFCVITDRPNEYAFIGSRVNPIPMTRPLPGWYSKINLFNPDMAVDQTRFLYFDLDVVITDSIDPLVECEEPFIMIREFNAKPEAAHNSSVMAWNNRYTADVFNKFADDWVERSWGDQECIWAIMGNDRIWDWPDEWIRSYKWHCRSGLPAGTRVAVFHGDPKQDDVNDKWVKEQWRD